jgi:hypothetical protein
MMVSMTRLVMSVLVPLLLIGAPCLGAPATLDEAKALVPGMRPWKQRGWTTLSDAPRTSVQQVQRTLERTRQEWDRFLRMTDRPRNDVQCDMVCIVFANTADFEQFARTHDNMTQPAASVPGYYSPSHGWIVFLDPGDHVDLDVAWADLDAAQRRVDDARTAGHGVDDAQRQLDTARDELMDHETIRRMALTAHETVHQLVHRTDAFERSHTWPLWLHEGLATSFETADRRRPFGPDRDFFQQRDAFLDRLDTDTAFSIEQILTLKKADALTKAQTEAAYIDGCALVSWLARSRRRPFAAWLDAIGQLNDEGERLSAEAAFRRHIGDPSRLTRSWRADERRRR